MFPSSKIAQPASPKPLFDAKEKAKEEAAKPVVKQPKFQVKERPAPQPGKVLFKDKAIVDSIDDLPGWVKANPAIQGMNNRNIRRAYFMVDDLSFDNTQALFAFGDNRRQMFSDIVNQIVEAAKNPFHKQAGDIISQVVKTMRDANVQELVKTEKTSWFRSFFHSDEPRKLEHTMSWFEDACVEVDEDLSNVDAIVTSLGDMVTLLDKLYVSNKDSFELLQIEIAAGRFFIEKSESEVPAQSTDAFHASEQAYRKMCLEQFKNKIADFEGIAQSVITNAPQIRMMQVNINAMAERVKTLKLVFARWKQQFANLIQNLQVSLNDQKSTDVSAVLAQHSSLVADLAATQASI